MRRLCEPLLVESNSSQEDFTALQLTAGDPQCGRT